MFIISEDYHLMTQGSQLKEKRRFIIKLGKALHKFGTPAYRLEAHLQNVANSLGLQASFIIAPTSLTFVLSENADEQDFTHIIRVNPGELDLAH